MSTFTSSMFDSIKDALSQDKQKSGSGFADIMRTEKGKMYTVRLLPNVKDPKKTFFHYYSHAWESFQTGQYFSVLSPTTFGERDPIGEYRYQVLRSGSEEEKNKAQAIVRREQWMVNVYVVEDPTNPENEGKVKILRYGRQLNKIITDAIEGDDSDQFGMRVFDLSKEGCSLRIKVEDQGGYPTYVSSKFLMPKKVDADPDEVYNQVHDLESIQKVKSYDELQDLLNEHFHCAAPSQAAAPEVQSPTVAEDDDDDIPFDTSNTDDEDDSPLEDDTIKELLAGLDSDE
jgi:hypothetical protein